MQKQILIIDDDLSILASLQQVLQDSGYAVTAVSESREGSTRLKQQKFDLLLVDLNLPEISGFDLLDMARELDPGLPVIVLTGLIAQCEPGALNGAVALFEKPPDVCALLKTVEWLLQEPVQRERTPPGHDLQRFCVGVPAISGGDLQRQAGKPAGRLPWRLV